jgi:hypothetical protein
MKRNSTDSRKENGNVTVAADDLVQLLNTWTFDSSRDEEDLVVPDKDSNAKHSYLRFTDIAYT